MVGVHSVEDLLLGLFGDVPVTGPWDCLVQPHVELLFADLVVHV